MKANQCRLDKAQTLNVHVIISRTVSSSFLAQRRLFLKKRDDRSSPSSLYGTLAGLTAVSLAERGLQRLHWVDRYGERKSDTCYLFQVQNTAPPHRLEFLREQLCPAPSVCPEWASSRFRPLWGTVTPSLPV